MAETLHGWKITFAFLALNMKVWCNATPEWFHLKGVEESSFEGAEHLILVPDAYECLVDLRPKTIILHGATTTLNKPGFSTYVRFHLQSGIATIACDNAMTQYDIRILANNESQRLAVVQLPEMYHETAPPTSSKEKRVVHIGCFGNEARSNIFSQAVAAIKYGALVGKPIHFHCTAGMNEGIAPLFKGDNKIVPVPLMEKDQFLAYLNTLNTGMQVGFHKTFGTVLADMVTVGLPVITSPEVQWISPWCHTNPNSTEDMILNLLRVNDWRLRPAIKLVNKRGLKAMNSRTKEKWERYFAA